MSITVFRALEDRPDIGARKFPAAPALCGVEDQLGFGGKLVSWEQVYAYMTKSMPPSSFTQRSTALFMLSMLRTSAPPIPITFAPGRAVAMFLAIDSVLGTLRPMMQALAPR